MIDFSNVKSIVIPEGEVLTIARGTDVLWRKQNKKYKVELEYLGSTETQYIDTGFIPNQDTRVLVDLQLTRISGNAPLFGGRVASKNKEYATFIIGDGTFQDGYGTSMTPYLGKGSTNRNVIDKNKNVFIVNGVTLKTHTEQIFQSEYTMFLFNINTKGSTTGTYKTYARLYSCKIYDNDALARDFIPVLDWNDRPCMYDKVTDELFYNAGTGEFLYG